MCPLDTLVHFYRKCIILEVMLCNKSELVPYPCILTQEEDQLAAFIFPKSTVKSFF